MPAAKRFARHQQSSDHHVPHDQAAHTPQPARRVPRGGQRPPTTALLTHTAHHSTGSNLPRRVLRCLCKVCCTHHNPCQSEVSSAPRDSRAARAAVTAATVSGPCPCRHWPRSRRRGSSPRCRRGKGRVGGLVGRLADRAPQRPVAGSCNCAPAQAEAPGPGTAHGLCPQIPKRSSDI